MVMHFEKMGAGLLVFICLLGSVSCAALEGNLFDNEFNHGSGGVIQSVTVIGENFIKGLTIKTLRYRKSDMHLSHVLSTPVCIRGHAHLSTFIKEHLSKAFISINLSRKRRCIRNF